MLWLMMGGAVVVMLGMPVPSTAQVTLVEGGNARAVIVLPVEATEVEQYAAEELVYHVHKGTGVTLEVVAEDAVGARPGGRVFLGNTDAARAAGIDLSALEPEVVVLRTVEGNLIVAGEDTEGDPISEVTHCGTLWGVYELLDRFMGVRWLWPGELGVHVPPTDSVVIAQLDETIAPSMGNPVSWSVT